MSRHGVTLVQKGASVIVSLSAALAAADSYARAEGRVQVEQLRRDLLFKKCFFVQINWVYIAYKYFATYK